MKRKKLLEQRFYFEGKILYISIFRSFYTSFCLPKRSEKQETILSESKPKISTVIIIHIPVIFSHHRRYRHHHHCQRYSRVLEWKSFRYRVNITQQNYLHFVRSGTLGVTWRIHWASGISMLPDQRLLFRDLFHLGTPWWAWVPRCMRTITTVYNHLRFFRPVRSPFAHASEGGRPGMSFRVVQTLGKYLHLNGFCFGDWLFFDISEEQRTDRLYSDKR